MAGGISGFLTKSYYVLAAAGGIYAILLGLLLNADLQRFALYAHKINTQGFWHNVSEPQQFGFGKNQVTPFYIPTADGESLYCWHVLPRQLYEQNEDNLSRDPSGPVEEFKDTLAYHLLTRDPLSRVVINFHGNAGHLANGYRPQTYHSLTSLPSTHVITCDYRGFGLSSGTPTEAGLITDAVALTSYVLFDLAHPSNRIVLLGQSLGTGVASATTLYFLDPRSTLIPASVQHPAVAQIEEQQHAFAGTVLVAPFTNIPELMMTYRMGGLFPVLSPLRTQPRILKFFLSRIVDTWPSLARLQAAATTALSTHQPLNLQLIHARNDPDISYLQSESIFSGVSSVMETGVQQTVARESFTQIGDQVRRGAWAYRKSEDGWTEKGRGRRIELQIERYGGHNRIVASTPVALAVQRAFEGAKNLAS